LVIAIQFQKTWLCLQKQPLFRQKQPPFYSHSIRLPLPERSGLYRKAAFFAQSKGSPMHEIPKKTQDSARNRSSSLLLISFLYSLLTDSELILVELNQRSRAPTKIRVFRLYPVLSGTPVLRVPASADSSLSPLFLAQFVLILPSFFLLPHYLIPFPILPYSLS
jgi:hypothetical protein